MSRIVVAGSFDTKAQPLALLLEELRDRGEQAITIDTSVFPGDPSADHPATDVAARAGKSHDDLPPLGRADAVSVMSRGAADILAELCDRGDVGALVCMGGSNAATVFSHLAPVLPLGIPKILMSTSVAGDTRPVVGAEDVVLLYPVVDVDGDNAILRRMIGRLAGTAAALKASEPLGADERDRPVVALTMYGVTTPCVQRVSKQIGEAGMEPLVFHANGPGGRSVESLAAQGMVDGVVDATLAELGNELLGGAFPAGPDRLTHAARMGVPQVIAPGAIDMIAFGPRSTVPEAFESRVMIEHNELVTLVRTTPEDCRRIGTLVAERLATPQGATVVCIPLGGTSMLDKPGEAFFDPDAIRAFSDGLKAVAGTGIEIVEARDNINDPEFADLLFDHLKAVMSTAKDDGAGANAAEETAR